MMRLEREHWVPAARVVALLVLPLAAACSTHESAPPAGDAGTAATRAVVVRTAPVETRTLQDRLEVTGSLRPRAQVNVASEIAGRVLRLARDEGARVAKGDVIALLDGTDYRLALDRAKAALQVADANRAHAQAERDRAELLLKTGGITDKDRLAAEVALQVAEASLAQARTEVAIAQQQVTRTEIRAPFTGRVAKRLADPGTLLAAGTPVVTLVDDAVLEFRAQVPSADYDKVRVGSEVTVTVDALPGWSTRGTLARITPMADERSRAFEVVVAVPGGERLIAGLFARAAVSLREVPGALVVPPAALVRDGARPDVAHLFVVEGGRAERREVTLGLEQSDAVQVVGGLAAGDTVVVDPPVSLASGAPVEIQNQKAMNLQP